MPRPAARPLVRDLVAVALLVVLGAGGYLWYRSAQAARRWQLVAREAEGLAFRIPPGWAATPIGYADQAEVGRQPGGILLAVRSFAIPPEIRALPGGERDPEATALGAWVEAQRALGGQRILEERRIRIDGARGVLQVFEDPRAPYPHLVVAAAAHDGRLYAFSAQVGPGAKPSAAVRTVRRILRTVEWRPRLAATSDAEAADPALHR